MTGQEAKDALDEIVVYTTHQGAKKRATIETATADDGLVGIRIWSPKLKRWSSRLTYVEARQLRLLNKSTDGGLA